MSLARQSWPKFPTNRRGMIISSPRFVLSLLCRYFLKIKKTMLDCNILSSVHNYITITYENWEKALTCIYTDENFSLFKSGITSTYDISLSEGSNSFLCVAKEVCCYCNSSSDHITAQRQRQQAGGRGGVDIVSLLRRLALGYLLKILNLKKSDIRRIF